MLKKFLSLFKLPEKKIKQQDFLNEKLSNFQLGKLGEKFALQYLESNGYIIVAKNYKIHEYEADLIALQSEYLVFVEVKTRRSVRFGTPSEAVDEERKRHYRILANLYMQKYDCFDKFARFDIIEITNGKLNHIVNAFQ